MTLPLLQRTILIDGVFSLCDNCLPCFSFSVLLKFYKQVFIQDINITDL